MQLELVGVGLEVVDGLLPVCRKDVLVLPIESLMDVCPRPCVQLCGRIALLGQLEGASFMSVGSGSGVDAGAVECGGRLGGSKHTAALAPVVCRTISI